MFRRTLAAVVTSASVAPHLAALIVGYDIESDEERIHRRSLRTDPAHAPADAPTEPPAPATTDA